MRTSTSLAVPVPTGWGWSFAARFALAYAIARALDTVPWPVIGLTNPLTKLSTMGLATFQKWLGPMADAYLWYNLSVAFVIGLAWTMVDRRRRHEAVIHEAARLACRYALAGMLLYYGGEKLVGDQGGWAHHPEWAIEPWGEIHGMQALMVWLSYSMVYAWFAGWAEFGAGLLMFSRRFTTLGAWLAIGDMGMVWLINQSYWPGAGSAPLTFVPMAVFLVAPHVKRSIEVLVLNRSAAVTFTHLTPPKWFRQAALAFKFVAVPWVVYSEVISSVYEGLSTNHQSKLQGLYRVETLERNGQVEPLAAEFPHRWRDVTISTPAWGNALYARAVNDEITNLSMARPPLSPDEKEEPGRWGTTLIGRYRRTLRMSSLVDSVEGILPIQSRTVYTRGSTVVQRFGSRVTQPDTLRFRRTDPDKVELTGRLASDSLRVVLRRVRLDTLPHYRYRWKPF